MKYTLSDQASKAPEDYDDVQNVEHRAWRASQPANEAPAATPANETATATAAVKGAKVMPSAKAFRKHARALLKLPVLEREVARTNLLAEMPRAAAKALNAALAELQQAETPADPLADAVPWGEPVDGAALLDETVVHLRRHVVMRAEAATAVALWIVHSHALDCAEISPKLGVTSATKRCGKTTLLDFLSEVVARPMPTSNVTPAVVFRIIAAARPTLLIDEADASANGNNELRGIINSSHRKRTAFVMRCEKDTLVPLRFSTWAPVALACIGELPDTIADRALSIRLMRRHANESVTPFSQRDEKALERLRRQCARFAKDNAARLKASPRLECDNDRAADNWSPLLAIADVAGTQWGQRAREAAIALLKASAHDEPELGIQLLEDLRAVFAGAPEAWFTKTLLAKLNGLDERPWSTCERGGNLTPLGLARLLRPFGIKSRTVRRKGAKATAQGFKPSSLADAFARYLPSTP